GQGVDELNGTGTTSSPVQNHLDPFAAVQEGPAGRSDARHRINISGVVEVPGGIQVAPMFRFRSSLPVNVTQGVDLDQNGVNNDISTEAFSFDGLDANNNPIVKSLGSCTTINCGRGAPQSTLNVRVSKVFRIGGTARLEAIGEMFNLFNALNPALFTGRRF